MLSRLHDWLQHARARLPTALPSCCALCGCIDSDVICQGCHQQFFRQYRQRCKQCAMPLPPDAGAVTTCGKCLHQPPAFDATISAIDYAAPVDQLVVALKFGGKLALAPFFAGMLRDALLNHAVAQSGLPDLLAPVPLGSGRLAERGFNQALEIARPLSRSLGIPLEPRLMLRVRDTEAQSSLHPEERRKNTRHAFIVAEDAMDKVQGKHIGMVDDVITTGETLNELAVTLKRFGAARVSNFVFARTLEK